jgi:hypothetical protein
MPMTKPLITSRTSDIPEIIDDCGIIVKPGSPHELGNAVFRQPRVCKSFGSRGFERDALNFAALIQFKKDLLIMLKR